MVARGRSGARARAIPQTARATTATAATLSPCSQPASPTSNIRRPYANAISAMRRRQREAEPRRDTAQQAGAGDADGDADLAAGGARKELAQRDEIGVGRLVQPLASNHVLVPEVAEVRHRPAEGGQPKPRRDPQHLQDAPDARLPAASPARARSPATVSSAIGGAPASGSSRPNQG